MPHQNNHSVTMPSKNQQSSQHAIDCPTDAQKSLSQRIKQWGKELGFADIGITDTDLSKYEADYFNWIGENFHGEMAYMANHGTKRTRPNELEPGTQSVISVRLNYLDLSSESAIEQLHNPEQAYISRYALGKDYHKLIRKRLQLLAEKIAEEVDDFHYRAFTDSAPVLERPLAEKAGLGFIGKNSLIIHPRAGSWFFLGELYTNLDLSADVPFAKQGCGPCTACIQECPTQAILDNAVVDARRCISYLTIEYKGSIPEELRPLMGNRIYGCDDCQLVCPWNKFTAGTEEVAFKARNDSGNQLDNQSLLALWQWDESTFLKKLEDSPIRRIGYAQWNRNLAVSLGNIEFNQRSIDNVGLFRQVIIALQSKLNQINELVDEHILWAVAQLQSRMDCLADDLENFDLTRPGNFESEQNNLTSEQSINPLIKEIKPFIVRKYYLPKKK